MVTDRVTISTDDAESSTGITKMPISRWRKRLRDPKKYREMLIIAAYWKAELLPPENRRAEGVPVKVR